MKYLPTGEQMKTADQFAMESIGMPSMVLMERAALKTVETMEAAGLDFRKVLVACGSGNNGGDGYAVARLLHIKGYQVEIVFVGSEDTRSAQNRRQKEICDYYKVPTVNTLENREYSVIVDAIFGTGLKRKITGAYYTLIQELNEKTGTKVAVDIPSGVHDASGIVMGTAFQADLTVAIAFAKRGLFLAPGNEYVGRIIPVDIGIPESALPQEEYLTYTYEKTDLVKEFPKRKKNSHKGTYGKVLMIVGSEAMAGAAYLSAKAAYATGAGLVQIYTPKENRIVLQQLLPEAIITTYQDYNETEVIHLLDWADVVGIGCGLGTDRVAQELVAAVLQYGSCPCVLDADGLNILAKHMEWLLHARQSLILTPHMKEMSRLLSCTLEELVTERIPRLVSFAEANAVVCVLKDARTLVAKRDENIYLNTSGNSAMAKGGSGDVLTGIIAGILAQGTESYKASCLGVYLHGLAGDKAREKKGSYSVLASDLIDTVGDVCKEIETR